MPDPSTPPEKVIAELRELFEDETTGEVRVAGFALLAVVEAAAAFIGAWDSAVYMHQLDVSTVGDLRVALAALGEGGGDDPKATPRASGVHPFVSLCPECGDKRCAKAAFHSNPCSNRPEEVPDAERH